MRAHGWASRLSPPDLPCAPLACRLRARALAPEPRILLLDEPTSALDSITKQRIVKLLGNLQERLGLTYLVICHDLGLAQRLADRIIIMRKGRVVENAPAERLTGSRDEYVQQLLCAESTLSL